MRSRVLLEKLTVTQLLKNFLAFFKVKSMCFTKHHAIKAYWES
jgi:hypothetical protein